MLTHREFAQLEEWQEILRRLQELFVMHSERALNEEKDIGIVRYNKGWVDAINEFTAMPTYLFPDPHDSKETFQTNEEPGESFISIKKDGSVY
jgi:hypothetical protein